MGHETSHEQTGVAMRVRRLLLIVLCLGIVPMISGCYVEPYPYDSHPAYRQRQTEHEAWEQRRRREREHEEERERERSHYDYEGAPRWER
jgi:hypothetical protein